MNSVSSLINFSSGVGKSFSKQFWIFNSAGFWYWLTNFSSDPFSSIENFPISPEHLCPYTYWRHRSLSLCTDKSNHCLPPLYTYHLWLLTITRQSKTNERLTHMWLNLIYHRWSFWYLNLWLLINDRFIDFFQLSRGLQRQELRGQDTEHNSEYVQ